MTEINHDKLEKLLRPNLKNPGKGDKLAKFMYNVCYAYLDLKTKYDGAYKLREQEIQRLRGALATALKALEIPQQIVDADMMYCVSDDAISNLPPYKVTKELIKKIVSVIVSRNKNTVIIIKQALQETTTKE